MTGVAEGELVVRILVATGLGALVGLERELIGKEAGLRTLALVSLGAAAFTVGGYAILQLPNDQAVRADPTRIAAQVVTGIGFLGAGLILRGNERVRGLTTAADLWAVAAIGLLCGLGMLVVASAATGLVLVILVGLRPLEHALTLRNLGRPEKRIGGADEDLDA